jgi:hypothetical protein
MNTNGKEIRELRSRLATAEQDKQQLNDKVYEQEVKITNFKNELDVVKSIGPILDESPERLVYEESSFVPSGDEELVSKFAEQLKTSQWELDNMEYKILDMNRETEVLYKALADISDIKSSYLCNMYRSRSNLDEVTSSVRSRYIELEQNYLKEFQRKDKVISLKGVEVEIAKGMSATLQEAVDAQALAAEESKTKNTELLANLEQKEQDFELQRTELLEKLAEQEQGIFFCPKTN